MTNSKSLVKSFNAGKELTVQYIPGHAGIKGNELADQEAKKYAKMSLSVKLEQVNNTRRNIRQAKDKNWLLE